MSFTPLRLWQLGEDHLKVGTGSSVREGIHIVEDVVVGPGAVAIPYVPARQVQQ